MLNCIFLEFGSSFLFNVLANFPKLLVLEKAGLEFPYVLGQNVCAFLSCMIGRNSTGEAFPALHFHTSVGNV